MMEYVQRELPYVRSFVLRSVYGVLRQKGLLLGRKSREGLLPNGERTEQTSPFP